MIIGLTYDLRSEYLKEGFSEEETAEFDKEETIAGIEEALNQLGYNTDRIGHARQLIGRLAHGDRWTWFSISVKVYMESVVKHRFPLFWTLIISHTLSLIRWYFH